MKYDEKIEIKKQFTIKAKIINIKLNNDKKKLANSFLKFNHFSLVYLIIYIFIIILLSINSSNNRILTFYDYIILHINKTGNHKIFYNNSFLDPETNKTIIYGPDEVYINGENKTEVSNSYIFEETNNKIELRWNLFNQTSIRNLFYRCSNITFIDFSHFDTSKITDMVNLFANCSSLTSINLNNFNTSSVKQMYYMFRYCSSLTSLNLSSFDTSNVTLMGFMFDGCNLLSSLDLSGFNMTKISSIRYMFNDCFSLTSLNLSNFVTPSLGNSSGAFNNCKNLTYLDISNMKTDNVKNTGFMFNNCSSLKSLNISNFDLKKVANMEYMFSGCSNLKYIDMTNVSFNYSANLVNMFDNSLNNPIIFMNDETIFSEIIKQYNCSKTENNNCVNGCLLTNFENKCYEICSHYFYYNETINQYQCTKEKRCPDIYNKLNKDKNECVKSCNETKGNKYEYNNVCYNECPKNFITLDYNCLPNCTEENPFLLLDTLECTSICKIDEYLKKCIRIYFKDVNDAAKNIFNLNNTNKNSSAKMSDIIIDSLLKGDLNDILDQLIFSNSSIIINEKDEVHQITALSNQNDKNISSISFGLCEDILKNYYKINDEELIIYKVENKVKGFNIPIIEYVLFNQNGSIKLNLSICDNVTLEYNIPVDIDDKKIYKYDPSSDYYNDKCNKYSSEENVDMTLYEKKNIYNTENLALCESSCSFKEYNSTTSNAICDCNIKSEMTYSKEDNKDDLLNKISNEKSKSNLDVTKCMNVFQADKIKTNSGFLTIVIILGVYIIIFIIFCSKGKSMLEAKIDEVIYKTFIKEKKKGKIVKNKNKNKNKKIKDKKHIININIINSKQVKIIPPNMKRKKNSIKAFDKTNSRTFLNKVKNKKSSIFNKVFTENTKNKQNEIRNKIDNDNDYELNSLSYKDALMHDKRTCCNYYISLIKYKQIIVFTFCSFNDYNSGIIKKMIFFISFALHYTINALFFDDTTMHQIYLDQGKFNFSYQFTKIIISSASSTFILRIMLQTLVLTDNNILQVKYQSTKKLALKKKLEVLKYINVKFAIFFLLNFILLILFGFYLTCFNGTYENTQIYLIKNTFISFGFSLLYPFIINIFPSIIRIISLDVRAKNKSCLYTTSKLLQIL